MEKSRTKVVTEIPEEFITRLDDTLKEIKVALQSMKALPREVPGYIPLLEFQARCKIGKWKFQSLRDSGLLATKKIGRKVYVLETEVDRYFNGELQAK